MKIIDNLPEMCYNANVPEFRNIIRQFVCTILSINKTTGRSQSNFSMRVFLRAHAYFFEVYYVQIKGKGGF